MRFNRNDESYKHDPRYPFDMRHRAVIELKIVNVPVRFASVLQVVACFFVSYQAIRSEWHIIIFFVIILVCM